VKKTSLVKEH